MRLAALTLLVACAACAGALPAQQPAALAARSFARALADDDPRVAYALLAASQKQRLSYERFALRWRQTAVERRRQSAALQQALAAGATLGERARLHLDGSVVTTLTRDEEGWRVEVPLLPAPGARTPREALARLADAIDDRSFNTVFRLLTRERQEGLRQAIDSFATGLRGNLDEAIEITSDRATLIWTDGARRWRVVLRREQGGWRIDDFSQQ
jgi:hypothetical protein